MDKVYATQDESGHWYVIPFELKDQFNADLETGESDEWVDFTEKYGQYMTGGDLNNVQLWANIDDIIGN